LSGLVWAAETYFDILGTKFVVQATDSAYAQLTREVLAPFEFEGPTGVPAKRRYGLVRADGGQVIPYRDCRRLGLATSLGAALQRLVAALNQSAIDEYRGFAVHAGVVASGEDSIAFPVNSGGGKSTLTAACLLAGFDYVSDEALCVDMDGAVVTYPKPLSLSPRSFELIGLDPGSVAVGAGESEGLAIATDLNAAVAEGPLTLRHLVLPVFGQDHVDLEEVAPSEAMTALLSFSFNHYKHGERAFHLAAKLASELDGVWRLGYGDPGEAAKQLWSHFGW
jgi:hypothetical protein